MRIDQIRPSGTSTGTAGKARNDLWQNRQINLVATSGGAAYQWLMKSQPKGSTAALAGATTATANFTPDLPGTYRVELLTDTGTSTQIKVARVRFDLNGALLVDGLVLPAPGELDGEADYGTNARGWDDPHNDLFNKVTGAPKRVATIADLRLELNGDQAFRHAMMESYAVQEDGGGGTFYWATDTTTTDDGGSVIVPTFGALPRTGCWKRQFSGALDVRWFGARGNGVADDTVPINRASAAANARGGGDVFFPPGTYLYSAELHLYDKVTFTGSGLGVTTLTTVGFAGTAGSAFPNSASIYGAGSYTSLGTLASDVAQGATTMALSVDHSADLSPGDYIFVYDSTDYSFSPERPYYRQGEFAQVRSVSGVTVTLCAKTFAKHRATGITFTADNTTNTLTAASHGLKNGQIVYVQNSGGGLPGGLAASTPYYVISKTTSTFKLAPVFVASVKQYPDPAAFIDISSNGTGTQSIVISNTVYKLNPIRTAVRNMSVLGFSTSDQIGLVRVFYAADCDFENVYLQGSDLVGLRVDVGVNISAKNVRMFDHTATSSGQNHGILHDNCQRVRVSDCDVTTSRIATDFGGGDWVGAVPNRDCIVSDSVLSTNGLGGTSAANMHGNSEWVRYVGCTAYGGYLSGNHCGFENCTIYSGTSLNEAVYITEPVGFDFWLKGCKLVARGDVDANTGLLALLGQGHIVATGETFVVSDCEFHFGPFVGKPWRLQQDVAFNFDIHLDFDGIKCFWDTASAQNTAFVFASTGRGFNRISMRNLNIPNGYVSLSATNAKEIFLDDVTVLDSPSFGIAKGANTASIWASEYVRVADCKTIRAGSGGILVTGQDQAFTVVDIVNNVSINNCQLDTPSAVNSSIYVNQALAVKYGDNTVGDDQAVQTQTLCYGGGNITTLDDRGNQHVGTKLDANFSSVNVYRGRERVSGFGTAPVSGQTLTNEKPAAAGAQQYSPALEMTGQGWRTDSGGASEPVSWFFQTRPVQGTAHPTTILDFIQRINLGTYVTVASLTSAGALSVADSITAAGKGVIGTYIEVGGGTVATAGLLRAPANTTIIGAKATAAGEIAIMVWRSDDTLLVQAYADYFELQGASKWSSQSFETRTRAGTPRFKVDNDNNTMGFFGHAVAAQPAAYTVAHPTTDRSLDVTGDTLPQVAEVLGTLIADLQTMGLIG